MSGCRERWERRRRSGRRSTQNQARFVNLDGKVEVKKVEFGKLGKRRLPHDAGQGRPGSHRPGRRRAHHLRGRNDVHRQERFLRNRGGEFGGSRPRHQRGHAHQFRRGGPGDRHVGVAKIEGGSFLRQCASFAAGKQPCRGAQRSGSNENQITVSAGAANMQVGDQHVEIGKWERVTFAAGGPR